MRQPITRLMRTSEEARDVHLCYARPDLRFFSAGACHILSFAFIAMYPQAGFRPRFIRPASGFRGSHLYVTNGRWAFDAQGYVLEDDLWRQHEAALSELQPGWRAEILDVAVPLSEFCERHRHRAPADFPGDVWQRARRYVAQFPAPLDVL